MESNPLVQFNLRDIYRIVFRHKRRCLAFMAIAGIAVVAAMAMAPRKYVSEAQLLVNVGMESLTSDPTTSGTPAVSLHVAREEELKSILDLFRSRAIAEDVVARLGPANILQKSDAADSPSPFVSAKAQLKEWLGSVKVSVHEEAVRKVRKMVSVSSAPKSNVISIIAEAQTPELAQQIVEAYAQLARQKHSTAHQTVNSTAFLTNKLKRVESEYLAARLKLRDFKNSMGVASIDGRKQTLEQQIRELQTSTDQSECDLQSFRGKIEQLLDTRPSLPASLMHESTTSVSAQSLDTMRSELYELRIRTQGIASRLTPSHPHYRGAMQQVEKAEMDLDIEELRFSYSNVNRLLSKIASCQSELLEKRSELEQLNEDEVQLKSLKSAVEMLEDRYERYNADLAKARIIEDRRSHEITNLNLFQPASKVETPVTPNRKLLGAIGVAAALFGTLALAFGSEILDTTLKTPEDIESQLELPLLETIPDLPRGRLPD